MCFAFFVHESVSDRCRRGQGFLLAALFLLCAAGLRAESGPVVSLGSPGRAAASSTSAEGTVLTDVKIFVSQMDHPQQYGIPVEFFRRELGFHAVVPNRVAAEEVLYIVGEGPGGTVYLVRDPEEAAGTAAKFFGIHNTSPSLHVGDTYTFQAVGKRGPVGAPASAAVTTVLSLPVLVSPYKFEARAPAERWVALNWAVNSPRHPAEMTAEDGLYVFRWEAVPGARSYLLFATNGLDEQGETTRRTEARLPLKKGSSYVVTLVASDEQDPRLDPGKSPLQSANTSSLVFYVLPK